MGSGQGLRLWVVARDPPDTQFIVDLTGVEDTLRVRDRGAPVNAWAQPVG
jgi:hypothetical protein